MDTERIIREALSLGACERARDVTDWEGLCRLFFSPQGREFCANNNYPSLGMFRDVADSVRPYGIYVDAGRVDRVNPGSVALVGDTAGTITVDDNTMVHKVILTHGAKASVRASNYAVILVVDMGGEVEIVKDDTVRIL